MIRTPSAIDNDVMAVRHPRILGDEISAAYTVAGILASPRLTPITKHFFSVHAGELKY